MKYVIRNLGDGWWLKGFNPAGQPLWRNNLDEARRFETEEEAESYIDQVIAYYKRIGAYGPESEFMSLVVLPVEEVKK